MGMGVLSSIVNFNLPFESGEIEPLFGMHSFLMIDRFW